MHSGIEEVKLVCGSWYRRYQSCTYIYITYEFRCMYILVDDMMTDSCIELVSSSPPTIKLKFEPHGKGHSGDPYYLSHKQNMSVFIIHPHDMIIIHDDRCDNNT